MHILVAGGGRVGAQTAEHLASEGHTVTVVESHEPTAQAVPDADGVEVVVGDAVSPDTIRELPVTDAEVFAALTGDTNANVAACHIVTAMDDTMKTLLRIGADAEREYGDHEAIDAVVFPEAVGAATATEQILRS